MVILFRHKALLVVSSILFASLLIQGISSGGMVLRMMEQATVDHLEGEATDQGASISQLVDDTRADLTILSAHRDVENYFTFRAFEELEGMTESLSNLELFFKEIVAVKPAYDRIQIALLDGTPLLQLDRGETVQRYVDLDPGHAVATSLGAGAESSLTVQTNADGALSLLGAGPLPSGGKTEGLIFLSRSLSPLLTNVIAHLKIQGIEGALVDQNGAILAATADTTSLPSFLTGEEGDWIAVNHPLSSFGWRLHIGLPRSDNLALFRNLLIANIVAAALLVGVIFWVVRKAFDALRRYNHILSKKVEERTAELEEANRELERIASTDALTGIANRRWFLEVANREYDRIKRHPAPLTLILLDIDHFKKINDTYGHAAGDAALKSLTACVGALLRSPDLFGRMGGEEFAILLPDTDKEGARILAERLRQAIEETPTMYGGVALPLTASFGVTDVAHCDRGIECSLQRGDEALYESKGAGRNRVTTIFNPTEAVIE